MLRIPSYVGLPLMAAAGYGALYWYANRSVYFPYRYPEGDWQVQASLGAQDVWLESAGGVKLHAWWIACPGSKLATLFLHGNAGNITHRARHAREIAAAGSSLLLLDYRGYGKSAGHPSEAGFYADADAGYQHLLARGLKPEQIVVHGESLGTAVAVDLAARRASAGVVLEAPFTSAREVAGEVLPLIGPLVVWSYNTRAKIPRLRAPLLIIHGDRDEIIPFEMGRALFDAAATSKSFWPLPGAGHNDIVETAGPAYRERLRSFYQSITGTVEP
jgi:fermentation-respiration switch protein FrsA (DUF1100 family)